jgi:hypothetical protein
VGIDGALGIAASFGACVDRSRALHAFGRTFGCLLGFLFFGRYPHFSSSHLVHITRRLCFFLHVSSPRSSIYIHTIQNPPSAGKSHPTLRRLNRFLPPIQKHIHLTLLAEEECLRLFMVVTIEFSVPIEVGRKWLQARIGRRTVCHGWAGLEDVAICALSAPVSPGSVGVELSPTFCLTRYSSVSPTFRLAAARSSSCTAIVSLFNTHLSAVFTLFDTLHVHICRPDTWNLCIV